MLGVDASAFYGAVAASGAAVFGVGAAVLVTRFASLAERRIQLELEMGDSLNGATTGDETQNRLHRWRARSRANAIADLHEVAVDLRRGVVAQLALAGALIVLSLLPLIGIVPDRTATRAGLVVLFAAGLTFWIRALYIPMTALIQRTKAQHSLRDRQRKKATERGDSYLVSGDPNKLDENARRLIELLEVGLLQEAPRDEGRRWRALRRWRKALAKPRRHI
jgi:hypothetical protein